MSVIYKSQSKQRKEASLNKMQKIMLDHDVVFILKNSGIDAASLWDLQDKLRKNKDRKSVV